MVVLGIVGAGNWGKNHIRLALELRDEGRLDKVVVCDVDPRQLKPWEGSAKTTTRLQDLLTSGVDATIVATPAQTHYDLARSMLEAGAHVLVEKPMTIRARDASSLAVLAQERELVLMPGHIFRYHPAVVEIKERIGHGFFGDLRSFATLRTAFAAPRRDVGVLYSLGIHEADLYPYILGVDYPDRARAEAVSYDRPEIDVVASLSFAFTGPCVGFALESWATPGPKRRQITIVGTKGAADVDYRNVEAMTVFRSAVEGRTPLSEEGPGETVALSGREPLREEVEDFLKAVETGGRHRPVADTRSGIRAVEIIESLKASASFTIPRGT